MRFNRAGEERVVDVEVPGGSVWVDRLDPGGRTFEVTDGQVTIALGPRSAAVLVQP